MSSFSEVSDNVADRSDNVAVSRTRDADSSINVAVSRTHDADSSDNVAVSRTRDADSSDNVADSRACDADSSDNVAVSRKRLAAGRGVGDERLARRSERKGLLETGAKPLEERRDEPAECSVTHHQHHIARLRLGDDLLHQHGNVGGRFGVDSLGA